MKRSISDYITRFIGTLPDYAILILDPDGVILSWNAGAEAIKGYVAEEIVGEHFSILYTPEAKLVGHPERELMIAAASGKFEERGWRIRKDGSRFWAHIIITPITDEHGDVEAYGKITRDITETKQVMEQMANVAAVLETTSRTDFLTGLENRRSLDVLLKAAIASARQNSRPLVLAMIDLDLFKAFNDEFGHQHGDRYLRNAAGAWRRTLRKNDILARYGGEEFTVVMPDATLYLAMSGLQRIRAATPAPLTCSIGAAQWDGRESGHVLLSRADRSLFLAKKAGRNRIETQSVDRRSPMMPAGRTQSGGDSGQTDPGLQTGQPASDPGAKQG